MAWDLKNWIAKQLNCLYDALLTILQLTFLRIVLIQNKIQTYVFFKYN